MRKFTNTNGNEDTRNTLSAYLRLSIVNENKFHVPIRYFYGCFEHIFFLFIGCSILLMIMLLLPIAMVKGFFFVLLFWKILRHPAIL